MSQRTKDLENWVSKKLENPFEIKPIQGDASFRHYFRIYADDKTWIAVDAPPTHENNPAFVAITRLFEAHQVSTPRVLAYDFEQGFMLLSDLGDQLLLDALNPENSESWYLKSFDVLQNIQQCSTAGSYEIPVFDRKHSLLELGYFTEWCLNQLLSLSLSSSEKTLIYDLFQKLVLVFEKQPMRVIHRDFHSRNLLIQSDQTLATIDYQDAMIGPITYDLVSLLKDCYIQWDELLISKWAGLYHARLKEEGLKVSLDEFTQWFDWVGIQRHLKVLGIFSRLKIRDNKARYLKDMPRILRYLEAALSRYPELNGFNGFFQENLMPSFAAFFEREGIEKAA